jgi:hypothetical protein
MEIFSPVLYISLKSSSYGSENPKKEKYRLAVSVAAPDLKNRIILIEPES